MVWVVWCSKPVNEILFTAMVLTTHKLQYLWNSHVCVLIQNRSIKPYLWHWTIVMFIMLVHFFLFVRGKINWTWKLLNAEHFFLINFTFSIEYIRMYVCTKIVLWKGVVWFCGYCLPVPPIMPLTVPHKTSWPFH